MFRTFHSIFSIDRTGMMLAFAMGLVLLYMAVPRTAAGFITAPDYRTLKDIQLGGSIDEGMLEALIVSRRRAAVWVDSGRLWSDLAVAELMLASSGDAIDDHDRIVRASEALETALSLAPASPHDWTRRAYAEILLNGPSEAVASALAMSVLTARYEPDLMFGRLELSFLSWPYFSDEDRALIRDQVRLAWRHSPDRLLDLAADTGRLGVVRISLAGFLEASAAMERRISR